MNFSQKMDIYTLNSNMCALEGLTKEDCKYKGEKKYYIGVSCFEYFLCTLRVNYCCTI